MQSTTALLQTISIWLIPVLFAITLHEVAHGYVAYKLGDPTAKMLGRLTLNPIKHMDPIGTVLVPSLFILMGSKFLFGWAKPVPVTAQNLKNPRRDMIWVTAAGPFANFLMAFFWAIIFKIGVMMTATQGNQMLTLYTLKTGQAGVIINILLMTVNLIPIPPLDGGRIALGLLPPRTAYHYSKVEPFGFFIILGLLFTGVLHHILVPVMRVFISLFTVILDLPRVV